MWFIKPAVSAILALLFAVTSCAEAPGYGNITSTVAANTSLSFGEHYAVLNLDLINAIVGLVNDTSQGQALINSTARWINAVHAQTPPPISIFTRFYYSNVQRPEVQPDDPFAIAVAAFGNVTETSPDSQIYSAFQPLQNWDAVLQKVRYYAGAGNSLELILGSQQIDTVILSGISTSGVILSTVYRLIDLNYKVYVISDNVLEPASASASAINKAILEGIVPSLVADVITVDQAIAALAKSGPAVY